MIDTKNDLKQVLQRLMKANKDSIGVRKQKQLIKLCFNEFLEESQKQRGRKKNNQNQQLEQAQKSQIVATEQGAARN